MRRLIRHLLGYNPRDRPSIRLLSEDAWFTEDLGPPAATANLPPNNKVGNQSYSTFQMMLVRVIVCLEHLTATI